MANTIQDSLKATTSYPIPLRTLITVTEGRGVSLTSEATQEILKSSSYRLATADLLLWLSIAPDVSQGGQSYSFTDEQRKQMRRQAQAIYNELEPEIVANNQMYGYKGSKL